MTTNSLITQANTCLESRKNIPGAPLWHMGKVAVAESEDSFSLLQNTVNYLTCKGQLGLSFTPDEKEFMKELFEALWWGGNYRGFTEAAKLANHYVNGNGTTLQINPEVYKNSVIVSDVLASLKAYIREQSTKNKPFNILKSSDATFMQSKYAQPLMRAQRNMMRQGYLLNDGALLVEQSNLRLKNTDHRFHLHVNTTQSNGIFQSRWRVESIYDFEPFEKGYVTEIPLSKNFTLRIPDGLSHHLTTIGTAKPFKYISEWHEMWE